MQAKVKVVPIGCDGGGLKPGVVGPSWVAKLSPQVVALPITSSVPGSETVNVYVWVVTPDSLAVETPLVNVTVGATLLTWTVVVYWVRPPSLSMIAPLTISSAGPSG